ncbi:PAQR family membrane homeostasis protein TrhA [Clostridium massiliodielmoense]|uniref:PAQR family membrane homeostasis protein TrhA n=1 Tax=Clostridium massiliodielmoense TaxID=1776385 RepID=UPI0001668F3E|nr:hemolysin III family protein [Clostridium massiliodielmoense]EDS77342.1 hemolysin-3 [Clostridium botulinum C str. Eklund]NEZ50307.1 hemolysin III family protein [Clostridium botulinum]
MNKFREPVSGFTHLFGVIISIVGLIVLINYERNIPYASCLAYAGVIIFGISLILLYTASSVYHLIKAPDKIIKFLRKLDHSMIYVLIAGTYTPVCLMILQGRLRWIMFILIWSCALMGVLFKMFWFNSPRWLSTLFYVLMGWIAVFIISPLSKIMDIRGIVLMFIGGVLYTLGAIIYATKWPKIKSKVFGFHEIFHLFVLAGSFCHYFMVLKYIA